MNNLKFLLLGTSLSCFPQLAYTQCVVTEDCAALGYTETSCPGNGVKCPFGNGWFCGGDEASICADNGFKYACTGTGYSGGSGQPCGGKYTSCTCSSGYEWKNGSCQKQVLNGAQDDLYYCDGKVVGVKTSGMDFFVAMNDLGEKNWNSANSSCQNYSFCDNLKGKLPTLDQLGTIYNNSSSLNKLFSANNGTNLSEGYYWSSTATSDNSSHYFIAMINGGWHYGNSRYDVRCILTSW